jgi:2-hydroxy-3-oxopropionate reductase
MNVGFIGLGIMGTPMALHLAEAGHQLFVHTRSRVPEAIAATSARRCASAAEVARAAEVVFTMVPDTPDVEAVLFGAGGIAEALPGEGARKVVVDMSSISPIATKAFARRSARSAPTTSTRRSRAARSARRRRRSRSCAAPSRRCSSG